MCTFYLDRKARSIRNDQFGPEIDGLMESGRCLMHELLAGELEYAEGANFARLVAEAAGGGSADARRLRELAERAEFAMEVRDLQNESMVLHERIEAAISKKDGVRPAPTPELHELLKQQIAVIDRLKQKDPKAAACLTYERVTRKLEARAAEFLSESSD